MQIGIYIAAKQQPHLAPRTCEGGTHLAGFLTPPVKNQWIFDNSLPRLRFAYPLKSGGQGFVHKQPDKLKGTSKNSCFVLAGLFGLTLRSENLEIHPVFLRFPELNLGQKFSPNPKMIVFRGALKFEMGYKIWWRKRRDTWYKKGGKDTKRREIYQFQWRKNFVKTGEKVYHNLKKGNIIKGLHFLTNYVNNCYKNTRYRVEKRLKNGRY